MRGKHAISGQPDASRVADELSHKGASCIHRQRVAAAPSERAARWRSISSEDSHATRCELLLLPHRLRPVTLGVLLKTFDTKIENGAWPLLWELPDTVSGCRFNRRTA